MSEQAGRDLRQYQRERQVEVHAQTQLGEGPHLHDDDECIQSVWGEVLSVQEDKAKAPVQAAWEWGLIQQLHWGAQVPREQGPIAGKIAPDGATLAGQVGDPGGCRVSGQQRVQLGDH